MSIQEHIAGLEALSALDEEIRSVDERLNKDRETLLARTEELASLEARIATDDQSITEMSKARAELVVEVRQVISQVDKSRDKLSRARNEREVNAVTRELEELRRIQKEREEEIGKLQMLEAQALKSKEEAIAAMVGLCEQPQSAQDDDSKGMEDIEASRKTMLEKRQSLTSQLPRQVLSRYELIRKRRGIAIAATSNGICTACHMVAPPQLFQKILRNDTLEQCPHCQRILYYKPEEPEETSE